MVAKLVNNKGKYREVIKETKVSQAINNKIMRRKC